MSEIPKDIMKTAMDVINQKSPSMNRQIFSGLHATILKQAIEAVGESINGERDRCLSILKSIEPMNPSEAHLIETIVRRIRGEV